MDILNVTGKGEKFIDILLGGSRRQPRHFHRISIFIHFFFFFGIGWRTERHLKEELQKQVEVNDDTPPPSLLNANLFELVTGPDPLVFQLRFINLSGVLFWLLSPVSIYSSYAGLSSGSFVSDILSPSGKPFWNFHF